MIASIATSELSDYRWGTRANEPESEALGNPQTIFHEQGQT